MIPNKPNEIVNQPVSNFSKSIDIPQQPYQPYISVSPQVPQEVPQYIPVYPVIQPQPIVQPQLIATNTFKMQKTPLKRLIGDFRDISVSTI